MDELNKVDPIFNLFMPSLLPDYVLAEKESFLKDLTRNISSHDGVGSIFSVLRTVSQKMLWGATLVVLVHPGCYTKIPHTEWLTNNRNVVFTVLESRRPRSACQHCHMGGLFQVADFLLCPHIVEGVRELCEVSFIRALI